ncbi:MAG: 2-oxo acid dehydrogenase subunit E2 [Acidilobus sp.]
MLEPTLRRKIPPDSLAGVISSPTVPRTLVLREAVADGFVGLRDELRKERPLVNISSTAILVRAVARLLGGGTYVRLNSRVEGDEAVSFSQVNVAVPVYRGGTVTAVIIDDAARRPVEEISSTLTSGTMSSDLSGATFALVNLGPYGMDWGLGLSFPQVASTLVVGRIRASYVVSETGGGREAHVVGLALSVDPRAVGPDEAGAFLADLAAMLADSRRLREAVLK